MTHVLESNQHETHNTLLSTPKIAFITEAAHKCITQLSAETSAKSKLPFLKNIYSTGAPIVHTIQLISNFLNVHI